MPDNWEAEKRAIDLIYKAQELESSVKALKEQYRSARDNPQASYEERLAALEPYRKAQMEQDRLYEQAIKETAVLFHVRPNATGRITIGEPDEADKKFMTGLSATWKPRASDSGPGVKLAVRIDAADGPHYSGATELNPLETDPNKPKGRMAITLVYGRVYIMKDTFTLALAKENLGFLAAVIYHETRHYNRLSWRDKTGKYRSSATTDEEERDAYAAENLIAKEAFGLSDLDIRGLEDQYQAYANAVTTGIPLTDDHLTPEQEAVWKDHYEHLQINLEDEYTKLQKDVRDERTQQLEMQARQRVEREREEQARKRSEAETAAAWKLYYRREMENEAARCGYTFITVNRDDTRIIAFTDKNERHNFRTEDATAARDIQDLKIVMLITRACDYVQTGVAPANLKACNDAAPALRNPMSYELRQRVENANASWNAECAKNILEKAQTITDSKSFDTVVTDYQKIEKKKRAKEAKENRQRAEELEEHEREKNSDGGRSRPPSEGGKAYTWDPGCSCWTREQ